jgi:hypothetical protein
MEKREEEEECIQNRTRARRDSQRDGTNTLTCNAGFNQSADEIRIPPPEKVYSQSSTCCEVIPNEMGPSRYRATPTEFVHRF